MTLVFYGYLAAALAHLGLAATLVIGRRFSWPMNYLLASSLMLAGWGVAMAVGVERGVALSGLIAIDALHAFAALLFLGQLIQRNSDGGWRRWFGWFPWLVLPLAGLVYWTATERTSTSLQGAYYLVVAVSVVGLLAAEQIYRNSGLLNRRVVSLIAVAYGSLFVFDLFAYSNAIMVGGLDGQLWAARGFVNAMIVPLLWVALRRDPDWQSGFFVSRHVVFYSASLVGVGLYLLLVAFGGVALQQFGGAWGGALQIIFLAASLILLVLVLFSQQLRRRAKVFLATHFYANRYDYREEWLKLIRRLAQDSERAPMPSLCLDALADIIDSDGGVLWLQDAEDDTIYRIAARFGEYGEASDLPVGSTLVHFMRETGWVIDGREAADEPAHYRNQFDTRSDNVVTEDRLFVPIVLDGELTGIAGLARPSGMHALNFEDHDLLRTVGQQLAVFLQRDRSRELLAEARQFEVFNRFTAFIMHDLKNLIAQQSLVVANAEKHKTNPEFIDDAMATIANSVKRMNKLLSQLQGEGTGTGTGSFRRPVDFEQVLKRAVADCAGRQPVPSYDGSVDALVRADEERLVTVLGHLLRNAQDACEAERGVVTVAGSMDADTVVAEISDNGSGMSDSFMRERLFKPFESTKGAQGMGIGVYQAREYVNKLGGVLSVASTVGEGTVVTVRLPRVS